MDFARPTWTRYLPLDRSGMPASHFVVAPVGESHEAQDKQDDVSMNMCLPPPSDVSLPPPLERCQSTDSSASSLALATCKICHCGSAINDEMISPCLCSGSLLYVHQGCLRKWITAKNAHTCELCHYQYQIDWTRKPLVQWQPLELSQSEQRKLICSIGFHVVVVTCILWSLWVLIDRTTVEVKGGDLNWPFWTKLIVVAVGFLGGLVFMYVQCKVYVRLFHRLKAFNSLVFVRSVPVDVRGKLKDIQLKEETANVTSHMS